MLHLARLTLLRNLGNRRAGESLAEFMIRFPLVLAALTLTSHRSVVFCFSLRVCGHEHRFVTTTALQRRLTTRTSERSMALRYVALVVVVVAVARLALDVILVYANFYQTSFLGTTFSSSSNALPAAADEPHRYLSQATATKNITTYIPPTQKLVPTPIPTVVPSRPEYSSICCKVHESC